MLERLSHPPISFSSKYQLRIFTSTARRVYWSNTSIRSQFSNTTLDNNTNTRLLAEGEKKNQVLSSYIKVYLYVSF